MKPEEKSQLLLGVTRSKAKMLEYSVPEEHHIKITQDPGNLFTISIGLLGGSCRRYQPGGDRARSPLGDENQSAFLCPFFRLLPPIKVERDT